MSHDGLRSYSVVYSFEGAPSEDGKTLLVEAACFDGSEMRFAIPVENIQHVVAFLLMWAGTMNAGAAGGDSSVCRAPTNSLPIPATAISVGEPEGKEGYLGISVGPAELVFSVPLSAFAPLGQSLLTLGAPANDRPA
jgi:hypothetical protein